VTVAMIGWATCYSMNMELAKLLESRARANELSKRNEDGNPCPNKEKPFPCRTSGVCIPMAYVCDHNVDCGNPRTDGLDEDEELCTAADRPPFDEISSFLSAEADWIIPNLFANKNIGQVAHGLTVSQSVDDFKRRLGMSSKDVSNLRKALRAVDAGNESQMERLGMPSTVWSEMTYIFSKLIKSGFTAY